MGEAGFWEVYVVTLGLLAVLLGRSLLDRDRHFPEYRLFRAMVASTLACALIELATWIFDASAVPAGRAAAKAAGFLLFLSNTTPLVFWALYVDYQVYRCPRRLRRGALGLSVLFLANAGLCVASLFGNVYFYFDAAGAFHRGRLHWVAVVYYMGLLGYVWALPILKQASVPSRLRLPLILYSVPALLGVSAQIAFYGLHLSWAGAALSLLILHTSIQNRLLSTDHLTGLYNRRHLDVYLRGRLRGSAPLALLMLDLDKFKAINDNLGHQAGDQALERAAALLRRTFHHQDFIARYAGDEFAVVLDCRDPGDLESVLARLEDNFQRFNGSGLHPFVLSVSVGAAFRDRDVPMEAEDLLRRADAAMYEDKRRRLASEGREAPDAGVSG